VKRALAALPLLAALGACGTDSSTSSTSSTTDCSTAGENAQVLDVMNSWYYWNTSIPAGFDPASYPSAAALLDAIRPFQPLDRFSYITTQAADQSFYGAGQYVGYGFGFDLDLSDDLVVTTVYAGSPAAQAGLLRGDVVTAINSVAAPTLVANGTLDSTLAGDTPGTTATLTYLDPQSSTRTATLTSAVINQPSVSLSSVIDAGGGQKVGYLLFNSFIDTSDAQLDQAFAMFAARGVTGLVVDERYNGGGEVSVAQHLATLILGNSYAGRPLATLTYNAQHSDQNQTVPFATVAGPLALSSAVFITTGDTASSSELVINSLRAYVPVATVGSATFGKPVGEDGFNVCSDVLYPITFAITNAAGSGGYFDGLAPTCAALDDTSRALGDPTEASLATALGYLRAGSCAGSSSLAALDNARRDAAHPRGARRYGFRQVVNAY
jgi:C-terminal processing protease CtpA/Prc